MEIKISFSFFFVIINNGFRFLRFDPLRPCPSIVTWLTYRILRARPSNKSAILTQSNRTRLRPRLKVRETSLSYERSSWERNLHLCVRPEQSHFPFATLNWPGSVSIRMLRALRFLCSSIVTYIFYTCHS